MVSIKKKTWNKINRRFESLFWDLDGVLCTVRRGLYRGARASECVCDECDDNGGIEN